LAGTPTDNPWALGALHEGARLAARKGSPATAVKYLRRIVELSPSGRRDPAVLVDLGLVEAAAGEQTSLTRFEAALELIDDPATEARVLHALGRTLYRYGRQEEAAETFRRGIELFEGRDAELARMFEGAFLCAALFVVSAHAEVVERLERRAAEIGGRAPRSSFERVVLAALSMYRSMTAPSVAVARIARLALGDGELLREETSEGMAANLAIGALAYSGAAEEAQRAVDAVLADARERGAVLAFAEASLVRALIMHVRGRVTEAIADAQAAVKGMERGWHAFGPAPHALVAYGLIERGDLDEAEQVLRAGAEALSDPAVSGSNTLFLAARGLLRLARGEPRAALDDFLATGELLQPYGGGNPALVPWRSLAGLAARALGDDDRARALVDQEIAIARRSGLRAQEGAALRVRALIEGDASGTSALDEAVAILEDADSPLELARALTDLGSAHRRAGRRRACREPLRRALHLAHECGATALERRAMQELHASGAKPRRAVISGVDALTPSELRVAELAASGYTNRTIAEMLFLTKNTVEWHLRHVFRKLDVNSRDELAARLTRARTAEAV